MGLVLFLLVDFGYCLISAKVMLDDDRSKDTDISVLACLYLIARAFLWPLIPVVRLLESPSRLLLTGEST